MFLRTLLPIAAVLLAAGCAAPLPNSRALDVTQRDALSTVEVVALVPQGGLTTDYMLSYSGGGLMWVAIDAGINNSRKKEAYAATAPLREALGPYDFGAVFKQRLDGELVTQGKPGFVAVKVSPEADESMREKMLYDTSANAVLFVDTSYLMSIDNASLIVMAKVALLPKPAPKVRTTGKKQKPQSSTTPAHPADLHNAFYYNTIAVHSTLQPVWGPDENRERWLANDGERLRQTLPAGLAELARLVAADLRAAELASPTGGFKVTRANDGTVKATARQNAAP